jgi:DnaK suppressor protein
MSTGPQPLTETQLEELGRMLRERHEALRAELEEEEQASEQARESRGAKELQDSSDFSSAEAMADISSAVMSHHRGGIHEVRAALRRLEDGSFGQCVECAREIGYERLRAYPAASRCIQCQSRREDGSRR